jgi:hypothetical protein
MVKLPRKVELDVPNGTPVMVSEGVPPVLTVYIVEVTVAIVLAGSFRTVRTKVLVVEAVLEVIVAVKFTVASPAENNGRLMV